MSDAEYPITPAQAARLARDAYPELAAHTQPTITSDEQTLLYEAARAGYDLPLNARHWRRVTKYGVRQPGSLSLINPSRDLVGIECPGCGHRITGTTFDAGPLPCDGCSHVYIIPPPREQP